MTHLNQPIETQPKIEIHARELERKAEGSRLAKLKARLNAKVQEQHKRLILSRPA